MKLNLYGYDLPSTIRERVSNNLITWESYLDDTKRGPKGH